MTTSTGRIQLRHPDPLKQMPSITKSSYVAARQAALAVLPKKAPGITLDEFLAAMEARLPRVKGWDHATTAGWLAMAIKLDMEARGELERVNRKPPQRLVRVK